MRAIQRQTQRFEIARRDDELTRVIQRPLCRFAVDILTPVGIFAKHRVLREADEALLPRRDRHDQALAKSGNRWGWPAVKPVDGGADLLDTSPIIS
jgi:hypothetical protein